MCPLGTAVTGCADESDEQRVRRQRAAFEFRVKLRTDKVRMVRELDNFHEVAVRIEARNTEAFLAQPFAVRIVHLIPVAVAF